METICLTCLQKDTNQRYESAQELVAELERFLKGEPIIARPVGGLQRLWRWSKRNPTIARLSVGVMLTLLTGIVFSAP